MVTRTDALSMLGGDTVQMQQTARALRRQGFEVDEALGPQTCAYYQSYDIVHVFNLQTLHFSLLEAQKAREAGRTVVLSTIYWNDAFKDRVLFNPRWMAIHKTFGERFTAFSFNMWQQSKKYYREERVKQRQLLSLADRWLPNSHAEIRDLIQILDHPDRCDVIPNGIDPEFFNPDLEVPLPHWMQQNGLESQGYALCCARIVPGKNQLSLAIAGRELGIPIVLAGKIIEDWYAEECQKHGAILIGLLNSDELRTSYKHARIHVLPSTRETPGLSSLEAGAMGCNIVTTSGGCTREYFGDLAYYCDRFEPETIASAVKAAWDAPKTSDLSKHIRESYNWDAAAHATKRSYDLALSKK